MKKETRNILIVLFLFLVAIFTIRSYMKENNLSKESEKEISENPIRLKADEQKKDKDKDRDKDKEKSKEEDNKENGASSKDKKINGAIGSGTDLKSKEGKLNNRKSNSANSGEVNMNENTKLASQLSQITRGADERNNLPRQDEYKPHLKGSTDISNENHNLSSSLIDNESGVQVSTSKKDKDDVQVDKISSISEQGKKSDGLGEESPSVDISKKAEEKPIEDSTKEAAAATPKEVSKDPAKPEDVIVIDEPKEDGNKPSRDPKDVIAGIVLRPAYKDEKIFTIFSKLTDSKSSLVYKNDSEVELADEALIGFRSSGENTGKMVKIDWSGQDLEKVQGKVSGTYKLKVSAKEDVIINDINHGKIDFFVTVRVGGENE